MLSGLLACVLVMGAAAAEPGMPAAAGHAGLQDRRGPPEPCCPPRYFTFDQVNFDTSVVDGKLLFEQDILEGAYDAVFQRFSVKVVIGFFNGTEIHLRAIELYEEGESFVIIEHQGESVCFKGHTEGRFPADCLTDFTYVNSVTLGDHDLVLDSWYHASDNGTRHVIKTVQAYGCAPVSVLIRTVDPATGQEVSVVEGSLFNFNLGICNPDEYFKPPPSCDEEHVLKEPTAEMLKFQRKAFRRRH